MGQQSTRIPNLRNIKVGDTLENKMDKSDYVVISMHLGLPILSKTVVFINPNEWLLKEEENNNEPSGTTNFDNKPPINYNEDDLPF